MDSKKWSKTALRATLGLIVLAGLFHLSHKNFLLFHTFCELFSIAVAWSVFLLVWNTRRVGAGDALVFLGIAFFFIGFMDFFHTLAYKGMGILGESDTPEYATQLWIAARGLEATSLLLFPLVLGRRLNAAYVVTGFALLTAALLASVFKWHIFPHCFIEGQGLTPFKKSAEYAICLVLAIAMFLLYLRREQLDVKVFRLMAAAMACTMAGEIAFTFYVSVYGTSNILGHLFKILSFFLIYLALVRSAVARPYEILFKKRKQAEEALRERERYLSKILETTVDGFWVVDSRGRILEVNNAYCAMSGYDRDELIGMTIGDLDALETPHETAARTERIIVNGSEVFETQHHRKDGVIWPVEISTTYLKERGGLFICFSRDLTERNMNLSALRKSEKEYRSTLNDLRTGVVVHANDTRILLSNPEAGRILGLTHEQMTGKTAMDPAWRFVHGDSTVMKAENYPVNRVLLTRSPLHDYLLGINRPDKNHITWVIVNATPVFADDGEIEKVIVNFSDITDRRQAEKSLETSEERLNKAQRTAKIGNWEYDVSTGQVWGSEEAFRIYGIERTSEYLPIDEVENHIIEAKRVNQALVDLITRGEDYDIEFEIRQKNSREQVVIHSMAELVTDEAGKPIKVVGVIQDITDKKAKEKENIQLLEQLKQSQKMESIGTLAGGIAHDFNNILFPIVGLAELLLEDLPPESLEHENAQQIQKAAERGSELVSQILAFSRKSDQKMMPLRVEKILEEALKLSRSTIPSNIEILQDIQKGSGLVMGDATKIHQIVINLITNAYHSVEKAGGKIGVHLKEITLNPKNLPSPSLEPGRYLRLSISDTGHGIVPENMERIFEPYFTTKEQGKGTGLGLAVVLGIVQEHGGDIIVDSKLGEGSTFYVYLPLVEKSREPDSGKISDAHPKGTETILLVDDEDAVIWIEKQMLERLGYKVISRTDSEDALKTLKADPDGFDLIITDMTMPELTGEQLTRECIKIRPDLPVIICTGFNEKIKNRTPEELGARSLLKKPISISQMARTVRKVLDT